MKYLLVLAVVLVAAWIWRQRRSEDRQAAPPPRRTPAIPAPMVACRHCGLHLPLDQAVASRLGHYCCAEHLRLGDQPR